MIFIIDDDKYVSRGFQILLRSAGLDSLSFPSVEDFLNTWDHSSTDLLILDIHMQGMNGTDLLLYLKQSKLMLPVIVITAYDEKESRELARDYGALAYFTKPVDSESLISIIRKNLNNISINLIPLT